MSLEASGKYCGFPQLGWGPFLPRGCPSCQKSCGLEQNDCLLAPPNGLLAVNFGNE